MKFTDVYGVEFGKRGNITKYPNPKSSDFEIEFTTPNHDESDVRFLFSLMGWMFNKNMRLELMDENRKVLYMSNRQLSFFINDSGIDPKAGAPSGHKNIGPTKARDTWLRKNTKYILRVYRDRHDDRNPISVIYQSLDVDAPEIPVTEEGVEIVIQGRSGIWFPTESG